MPNARHVQVCDCEACTEALWRDKVFVARFNHPVRYGLADAGRTAWWMLRAIAWSWWTVALVNAVLNLRQ